MTPARYAPPCIPGGLDGTGLREESPLGCRGDLPTHYALGGHVGALGKGAEPYSGGSTVCSQVVTAPTFLLVRVGEDRGEEEH
ncbi:hypothetical protein KM043_014071 [Ampulex compressa]|nr:hypothetical protein KM043_014071 [Ampulex compressa]